MAQNEAYHEISRKIALVGNHLPRHCGIATFTTDLLTALAAEAPEIEFWGVVMNDTPEGYRYPSQVRFEVNQRTLSDYRLAADFLNMSQVDVVCLQHEFGIFGGDNGTYILDMLANLRMPSVTTLHTVLQTPTAGQITIIRRIAQISDRIVVMSRRSEAVLREVYNIPQDKVVLIHHGIPDVPFVDPNYYKDQFGVEGRKVLLTFGLLSPGKGIETVLDALPKVVEQNPDVVYIVLGATHPHVKKEQGEGYRLSLQRRARDLGIEKHLIFHNRFVDLAELCAFLGATDVYVTPYLNREQVVSGTLAYALGAGKATVSTPYWYAEEMLAEGRGRIIPFQDAEALASQVNDLFTKEVERHAMRKRAYTFCRDMIWSKVARRYLDLFSVVKQERKSRPRAVFPIKTMNTVPGEIPNPDLSHIIRLTDNVGILQHTKFIVPNRLHGYCTDDNARALIAILMAQDLTIEDRVIADLACTYISFLYHAYNENAGRFRNFMGYDRRWSEETGSEDSHGRAVWGLGEAIALCQSDDIRGAALDLFERALPALIDFESPRAWSFALVGIHAYLRKFSGDSEVRRIRERLANRLFQLYQENATSQWPWIEQTVTYANGKIPQALIMSGQWVPNEEMIQAGLCSLEWLIDIQTDDRGYFIPIGNNGWYIRGGAKARFDQQPIEALNMIEACRQAYNVTSDTKWIAYAQRCMEWFLGRNDLGVPLYNHKTGGCFDGLTVDGPNRNQGAESTLACVLSLLNLHKLRSSQVAVEASAAIAGLDSSQGR
ncbi:MAG: glycosyltransferase [Anaerolineae bacterium]|nr:glycosyltransferase [Anaerolineae bacterium]